MIAALALRFAGTGAHLVARPAGVPHVYVGPLTRSGKSVPRASRPVCRAHTRRLAVVTDADLLQRVCARCAACLRSHKARQAAHLNTRTGYQARFAGVTGHQLVAALADAATPVEVDEAAHLTLVLYGHTGCRRPDPTTGRSLHDRVTGARRRFQTTSGLTRLDELRDAAQARRRADQQTAREERENRIARIGIRNAKP